MSQLIFISHSFSLSIYYLPLVIEHLLGVGAGDTDGQYLLP